MISGYLYISIQNAGTISAGQSVDLKLTCDITQNTFQTVLQAAVLITTSGRPAAKVGLPLHATSPQAVMPSALREGAVALNTESWHLLALELTRMLQL